MDLCRSNLCCSIVNCSIVHKYNLNTYTFIVWLCAPQLFLCIEVCNQKSLKTKDLDKESPIWTMLEENKKLDITSETFLLLGKVLNDVTAMKWQYYS